MSERRQGGSGHAANSWCWVGYRAAGIDGCDGPRIASAPLPASPAADGFAVVEAAWSSPVEGARDLCIRFSGDTRPAMWVLDTLTLLPAATE